MMSLDKRLDGLNEQLDALEAPSARSTEPPLDSDTIRQCLLKIEQQWGQGLRALRQELHQTILAHNHNADLMKHHKDTLDQLKVSSEQDMGNARNDQWVAQMR